MLIRILERYDVLGVGVDSSADSLAEAQRRAAGRIETSRLQLVEADAQEYAFEPGSFELVICMGASHAFGLGGDAVERAIGRMARIAADGGLALLADGYLKRNKPDEYRKYVGDEVPDDLTHAAIIQMGRDAGLTPLAAWTSTVDEWDEFEWGYQRIFERKANEQPADPSRQEKLARRRDWMDAYVKWGRDTLGYGTYLFMKPQNG